MNIYDQIIKYMDSYKMLSPGDGVVAGISGGADSVCLLTILSRYRKCMAEENNCQPDEALKIVAVHINHMIRGSEADEDQIYVQRFCEELGVHFVSYKEDIPKMAQERHLTEEEAGRIFRYECFKKEADKLEEDGFAGYGDEVHTVQSFRRNAVKIAVAHNKNDLAETVLYNMIRGSSLLGLSGIKPVRGRIIRPLLMTERSAIEEYLNEQNISYRTDSTNLVPDYSRNKIRLMVMPLLREINAGADQHIADIALDAIRYEEDINKEIDNFNGYLTDADDNVSESVYDADNTEDRGSSPVSRCELDIQKMAGLGTLARGELILRNVEKVCGRRKDITRDHVTSILKLTETESGKRIDLPYNMYAERVYDKLIISLKNQDRKSAPGSIEIRKYPYTADIDISKKEYTKMLDCDKINNTLVLRNPRPDDYIVINEAGNRKKLSRFFTAQKVERDLRRSIPVVADGNEIVWIVGMRLSERYKIGAKTREVIEITYHSENERKA